jgi:hypothetical protein
MEIRSRALAILGFALILSTSIVTGCGTTTEVDVKAPDVEVKVDLPGVSVDIDVPHVRATVVDLPDVIRGSGNVVTEDRKVSDFDRISLTGSGKVIVTQGGVESLVLKADDNLMRHIQTEVKEGTLVLGFSDEVADVRIRPSETIQFVLSAKEIAGLGISGIGDIQASSLETDRLEIVLPGAGNVVIDSLTADELAVRVSGAGSIELAGQVARQEIAISGLGQYRAPDLCSETAQATIPGAGNVAVWATESLDVRVTGVGNVEYRGRPSITQRFSGLGKVANRGS